MPHLRSAPTGLLSIDKCVLLLYCLDTGRVAKKADSSELGGNWLAKSLCFLYNGAYKVGDSFMTELASEKVIVAAPMSFTGSAQRLWRLTEGNYNDYIRWFIVMPLVALLVICAWAIVLCWYIIFGIFLIPYRLIRRGQRKNKRDELRHRELLAQLQANQTK